MSVKNALLLAAPLLLLAACAPNHVSSGAGAANTTESKGPQAAATPAPQLTSAVARVNYYRGLLDLPKMTIAPSLNDGAAKHARYVSENHLEPVDFTYADGQLKQFKPAKGVHEEDPGNPWYTRLRSWQFPRSIPLNPRSVTDNTVVAGDVLS